MHIHTCFKLCPVFTHVHKFMISDSQSLQTSRVGRLAAFADSQHSHTSDQPDSGGSGGGRGNGLPEPVAEIVFAKLVVVSEERGGRVRRGREVTEERGGRAANGVNFKKFIKVTLSYQERGGGGGGSV